MSAEPTTPLPIHYRRATNDDAAAIAALGAAVWVSTYCDEGIPRDYAEYILAEFNHAKLAATLAAPDTVLFVAEAHDRLLGFVDLRLGKSTDHLASAVRQAEVSRLYILNRFARRGIGRALLGQCHTTAAGFGTTALWLTMYGANERARAFYRALGWQKVGDTHFILDGKSYPNDVLVLPVTNSTA